MGTMTRLKDHEDENGQINWGSYRKAQIANGEICTSCGAYVVFGKGYPEECSSCKDMSSNTGEVDHETHIRCPACAHIFDADKYEIDPVEGETSVYCPECDYDFDVSIEVTFKYTSPPLLEKNGEREEDDDDDEDGTEEGIEANTSDKPPT